MTDFMGQLIRNASALVRTAIKLARATKDRVTIWAKPNTNTADRASE